MKRQRYMVLRLWRGGFLGKTGAETIDIRKAFTFRAEDGYRVLTELRPRRRDYGDLLHGVSLELLPKRGKYDPFDEQRYKQLLADLSAGRIVAQAESFERQADGYLVQAKYHMESAAKLRYQAAMLRQTAGKVG